MVDTKFTTAAQKEDKKRRKDKEIEKEKKEKKNKKTKSSETLEDGSVAPETITLDWENGKDLPKKGKGREILLTSIAVFLESNGFTKTHSVFRSEAHLEKDGLVASFINLEDLFCKYLESSKGHADATIDWPEEKDIENSGIPRKDEGENIHDASEHIHKKKRKHKYETDDGTKAEINEHGLENGSIKCLKVKSKEKEMNRSAPAGCSAENTGVFGDKNMNELNSLGNIKDLKMLKSAEDSHVETKDKKMKNKYVSDSLEENGRKNHLEDSCRTAENTIAHHDNLLPKTDVNDKAKRKKKNKMSSDACDENTESGDHRKFQEIVEEKIEELKSLTNNSSALLLESNAKHKREKKKKTKAASDALAWTGREEYAKEDLRKSDSGKENVTVSEENVDNIGKKAHKKRKRSASEERASQAENEMIAKESKHVNLNGAENNKETGALQKPDKSLPDSEYTTIGKTRKTEKSSENPNQTFETSLSQQNPSAQDIQKELGGHQMANGNPEKNEKEGGASSKSMKKEKHSAEAKTVNAFQRVKIDEVKFADERLQDNSYWALDGTGSGYGAKAQEVLGQVRGRDFRHEKTKKKRGTYRGGQIDLQSHSIKFNYSDEE